MEKKNYGVIGIFSVIIVAFIGLVFYSQMNKEQTKPKYSDYNLNAYIGPDKFNGEIGDHVKGDVDKAKVVIVEYADYQCPGCATMNPRINKLVESYKNNELAVIYRNFVMSYHQNGTAAAVAAEAAGLQGFWKKYADTLFANQSDWEYESVEDRTDQFVKIFETATEGKGNVDQFKKDMVEKKDQIQKKISFDAGAAEFIDVPGTPSLYVNGERIDTSGVSTDEDFIKRIKEKIDPMLENK